MTNTFDETGIQLDSLSEVREGLTNKFKAKFGDDIKTDDKSVFGQIIGVVSEVISDMNDLIQKVVNAYDPSVSSGVQLDNLVAMNGINRKDSEYSTVTIKCTANDRGCTIPAGSIVSNVVSNEKFVTDIELVLAASTDGDVSATAQTAGPVTAEIGSLTKIETPILGWQSVTNESAASPGADREVDTKLRLRRRVASERNGYCNPSAIYTALFNIDEVSNVRVYDSAIPSAGFPANHVWCVVKGGDDSEIAEAIYNNVAGGVPTWGTTTIAFDDPVTGETYAIKFSRSTDVPFSIRVGVVKNKYYPSDGDDQIKQNILDFIAGEYIMPDGLTEEGIGIHDTVYFSRLYTPINAVSGHYVKYLYVDYGTSSPDELNDISVSFDEIATIDVDDIEIEETY